MNNIEKMPKFSLKLYLNSNILCKVEITSSYIDFETYIVFKKYHPFTFSNN